MSESTKTLHDVIITAQNHTYESIKGPKDKFGEYSGCMDIFLHIPYYYECDKPYEKEVFLIIITKYKTMNFTDKIKIASLSTDGKVYWLYSDEQINKEIQKIKDKVVSYVESKNYNFRFTSFPFQAMCISALIAVIFDLFNIFAHRVPYTFLIYLGIFLITGIVSFQASRKKSEHIPLYFFLIHFVILVAIGAFIIL